MKIEPPELDKPKLPADLNGHGADHGLHFVLTDSGYDYRITYSISQSTGMSSGSTSSVNSASADVYDLNGTDIFKVFRNNRWTERGVTNALSKEIVKRVLEWRKQHYRQMTRTGALQPTGVLVGAQPTTLREKPSRITAR